MAPAKLATARKLYDTQEHTVAQIAEIIGVSRSTVHRALVGEPCGTRKRGSPQTSTGT